MNIRDIKSILRDRDMATTPENVAALTTLLESAQTAGFNPDEALAECVAAFRALPSFDETPSAYEVVATYMATYLNGMGFYPSATHSVGEYREDGLVLELIGAYGRGVLIDTIELSIIAHPNAITAVVELVKTIVKAAIEPACDVCGGPFEFSADGTTHHLTTDSDNGHDLDGDHVPYSIDIYDV